MIEEHTIHMIEEEGRTSAIMCMDKIQDIHEIYMIQEIHDTFGFGVRAQKNF